MTPAPDDRPSPFGKHAVPLPTLLFAGFGSAVSWGVHFSLVYVLTTLFCKANRGGADVAVFLVTAMFAALSLAAGWVAFRRWRALGYGPAASATVRDPISPSGLLLFIGMAGAVLFTLFIVVEGLVPLFQRPCGLGA